MWNKFIKKQNLLNYGKDLPVINIGFLKSIIFERKYGSSKWRGLKNKRKVSYYSL
jgi:hypothetical protein